jgi:hypothetical protein
LLHLQLRQTDEQFDDFFVASPGLALAGWTYDLAFDDVTEVGNFFAHTHEVTTNWPLYAMLVQMYGALGWNELLLLRSKVFLTDDDDEEDGEGGDGDVDGGDGGGEGVVAVEEDITVEEVVNDDEDKEEEIEVREGETKTKKEQDSVPTDLGSDPSTISSIDSTTVQETTENQQKTEKQKKIKTTNPETKPTTPTTPTKPTATTPPIQIPRRSLQPALESLFQTLYLDILSLNEWTEEQIEIDRQDAKDAEELR